MFLLEAYFACHACNNFSFFISYHSSETSGDCLYSSASIVLVGDNTLVEELRAMTCIELFLNAEYYSKHPIFSQVFDKHSNLFSSIETLLKISVSDVSFNTGLLADNLVKHEAIHNCRQNEWSSFLCILGLSTVIARPICCYYPDFMGLDKYSVLFNQHVCPRFFSNSTDDINILFCQKSPMSKGMHFIPNHFVPLVLACRGKSKLATSSSSLFNQPCNKKKIYVKKPSGNTSVLHFFKKLPFKKKDPCDNIPVKVTTSAATLSPTGISLQSGNSSENVITYSGKYDVATYFDKASNCCDKDLLDFIKNVYVPPKDFSFPKHKCGSNVRMFQFEWLKDFPWLAYSPSLDGAFCLPCVIFGSKYPEKSKLVKLFKEPLTNWSIAVTIFAKHQGTHKGSKKQFQGLHTLTNIAFCKFLSDSSGQTLPINVMVDNLRVKKNS